LTAPGRSEGFSVTKEWEISGTAALHVAGPMSPGYPLKTQKSPSSKTRIQALADRELLCFFERGNGQLARNGGVSR
jgi:hypothetical protein